MGDLSSADRMDGVVPVSVKPMGREPEGGEVLIGDGAALRIRPTIQLAPDSQAGGCPGGADQVDDYRQCHFPNLSPRASQNLSSTPGGRDVRSLLYGIMSPLSKSCSA